MPQSSNGLFRVTLLGTGAPPPTIDRFGPSTLVEAGPEKFLFGDATADDLIPATRPSYDGPLVVGEDLMQFEIGDDVRVKRFSPKSDVG